MILEKSTREINGKNVSRPRQILQYYDDTHGLLYTDDNTVTT